jgi:predicted nucleic acid-binding protein
LGELRERLRAARLAGAEIQVPVVVVAETTRGNGPRDAAVNHVIARCEPALPLDVPTARVAGQLLGEAESSCTVDSIVVAEALAHTPSIILTSDPGDIARLLGTRDGVIISSI